MPYNAPKKFQPFELGQICSRLSSGKGISAEEISDKGTFPVYGGNGLRGYSEKKNFEGQCAIVGRQGAFCGNVRYFSGEAYMTEHAIVVCANEKSDTRYLSYVLGTMALGRLSGQSAQPGLSVKTLSKQIILLPDVNTQRRIASLLALFDEKIALNAQINQNLEAQAQAIFKSWFVDFDPFRNGKFVDSELGPIPVGWRSGTLKEMLDIRYGKDHKRLSDGTIPVYGSGGLMRLADKALYSGESVLIPRKGTLNNVMRVSGDFWTVDTMFYSVPKCEGAIKFAFHILRNMDLASMNSGSAVPSMTTDILNAIDIVIPPQSVLASFEETTNALWNLYGANLKESNRLASLRDTLLPKLMSGEIDVSEIEV